MTYETLPTKVCFFLDLPKPLFRYHFFHILRENPSDYIDLWSGVIAALNGDDTVEFAIILEGILSLVKDEEGRIDDLELNNFIDEAYQEIIELVDVIANTLPHTEDIRYTQMDLHDNNTIIITGQWYRNGGSSDT